MGEADPRAARLAALIAAYRPDPAEAASHQAMQAMVSTSSLPYARESFQPGHFTASGFVRSPDQTSVLLVEHLRLQRWLQPGGHVDPDDSGPLDAAMREIVEETGCAALDPLTDQLFGIDVHAIPARHDEPPHRHYDLQFAFQARTDRLEPSDEVAAASWVVMDDVSAFGVDGATRKGAERLRRLG